MPNSATPPIRERASLVDHEPSRPLHPDVVQELVQVPLTSIEPDPTAFATRVDLRVAAMAQALERDGQINAVHLRDDPAVGLLQVICGHRRIAALRSLGKSHVVAVVHEHLGQEEAWRLAWTDNVDRKTMSALDRKYTVARLMHDGHNQRTVAAMLGVNESVVSRDAAWAKLPDQVRRRVADKGFTFSHAVTLLPFVERPTMQHIESLIDDLKSKPCDVQAFRLRVRKFFAERGGRLTTGARIKGETVTIDTKRFDASAMSAVQRQRLVALLRPILAALE